MRFINQVKDISQSFRLISFLCLIATLFFQCISLKKETDLQISLEKIEISCADQIYKTDTVNILWYYPYQMVFIFNIENNNSDSIVFRAEESILSEQDRYYGTFRIKYNNKEYKIGAMDLSIIPPNSNVNFNGYNIDLPIFDKVFTKKEFQFFCKNFIAKASFNYNTIWEDYLNMNVINLPPLIRIPDKIDIKISKNFKYTIANDERNIKIEVSDIGFPFNNLPDNVFVSRPYPGFDY